MSISNLGSVNNGFDLKCNSIETKIPIPGAGGDVVGPAGAQNEFVPVFDGTSGKILKSSTVKATGNRFQGFDPLNNPAPIEFNGDISMLGSDILNIGTIAPDTTNTNLISPKTGTSISFNNKDITDLNTVISTNVDTDFIGSASGSTIEFSDKPQSSTAPAVDDDLTNKLYVDTAISGVSGGDVSGPAASIDEYIPVFDGTSGKILKSSTIKATGNRFQGFDVLNNPAPIEFNGDISLLGFDILNIGTIGPNSVNTNIIAPKTGTSISFNNTDIQDLNTVISTNVDTDFIGSASGSTIEFSDKPQSSTAPSVSDDLTNKLYVDSLVGNLYCMIADGPTVIRNSPETSLLASGVGDFVGTLTVPAGGFAVGDAFHFVVAGDCVFDKDNEITLKLKNGGVLASITMELEDTTGTTNWELEADFIIRRIGATGSIITNFDFTFNKKALKDFKGVRNVVVSSINTTVTNTLDITAQFTVNPDSSSIQARMAYLKRMH